MDAVEMLVQSAEDLTIGKYLLISTAALTLYDYLLMFDDEIRYVWRGRKTWISYLYILNRFLLTGYQVWDIYLTSSPRNSKTVCLVGYHLQVISIMFFLISSDIFITLRLYAMTAKNKILAVYFSAMSLTRLVMALVSAFGNPSIYIALPQIPDVDALRLCGVVTDLKFKLVPNSISTAFELSAFIVIVWCTYRNKSTLKFSALIRTIVAEATIYFLAMVAIQTFIQLSLSLMEGIGQQLSFLAYGLFNPILTMRFALSLKRTADPRGGQEWQLKHFSTVRFASGPSPDIQPSVSWESVEMDPVDPLNDRQKTCEP